MRRIKKYTSYKNITQTHKPEYNCIEIQNLEDRKKILKDNRIVCIDLFANWCEPCKIVAPSFSKLAEHYNNPGRCLLVKENIELNLPRDFQVAGIPAFIFYKDGKLVTDQTGNPVSVIGIDLEKVKYILDKL